MKDKQVMELAKEIDPECWTTYFGHHARTMRQIEARRQIAIQKAQQKIMDRLKKELREFKEQQLAVAPPTVPEPKKIKRPKKNLGTCILKSSVNKEEFKFSDSTYYLVEVAMNKNNPVFKAIFYSGFVNNGNRPLGYNAVIANGEKIAEYHELHYLKVLEELAEVQPYE